jgi:hypothetical protein
MSRFARITSVQALKGDLRATCSPDLPELFVGTLGAAEQGRFRQHCAVTAF